MHAVPQLQFYHLHQGFGDISSLFRYRFVPQVQI
jgi:hypothetical protein